MKQFLEIEDLRKAAKARLPRMFYDYIDTGSWSQQTYRENTRAFEDIRLRQRVGVNMDNRSLETKILGQTYALPIGIAPTGNAGMNWPNGEMAAVKACNDFNVPYCLSTMSICSIEDVASVATAPFWFQIYVMRDREFSGRLIDRAKAAGCSALMLTLDLQIIGQRHKDLRNGLSSPPKINFNTLSQFATRPHWVWQFATQTNKRSFRNVVGHVEGVADLADLANWARDAFDASFTWDDVAWIKDRWGGPLIIKGVLDAEDAAQAVKTGADALIVSNHGGRQLDGALSSIEALPQIVAEVGDKIEVHFDGGVRSGQDVLKAKALGAQATYIGRSYLYGLAAAGGAGVTRALEILRGELDTTLALCGETHVNDLGSHNLIP